MREGAAAEEALTPARGLPAGTAARDENADDEDDHEDRERAHDTCDDADVFGAGAGGRRAGADGERRGVARGRGGRGAHRDASFVRGALLPVALPMAAEVGLGVGLLTSKVELGTTLKMLPTDAADELVAEAVADGVPVMGSDEAALCNPRSGQRAVAGGTEARALTRAGRSTLEQGFR